MPLEHQENRRGYRRVSVKFPLELADLLEKKDDDIELTITENISVSGMYCKIKRYIPPLTKVGGVIQLPIKNKGKKTKKEQIVFKGVVVRIEKPEKKDMDTEYKIAIFFQDMVELDKNKIIRLISSKF